MNKDERACPEVVQVLSIDDYIDTVSWRYSGGGRQSLQVSHDGMVVGTVQ